MKRIIKLCPFAFLLILTAITASLGIARYYGYEFVPSNPDKLVSIFLPAIVLLTVVSILTRGIRSLSASILPLSAVIFSMALCLCMSAETKLLLTVGGVTVLCSVIMSAACGRKGFIRATSFLLTALIIAAVWYIPRYYNASFLADLNKTVITETKKSPDGKLEARVVLSGNKSYRIKVVQTGKSMYFFVGTFRSIKAKTLSPLDNKAVPSVEWADNNTIKVNDKEYNISF